MTTPTPQDETHEIFVIEGVISKLQVALSKENLLAQIATHCKTGSAVIGLGAALGGFHNQAVAAASAAFYAGEDIQCFGCLIGEQVMLGAFGGASKLPVGKKVRAVVSKHEGILVARGILSEDTGLVWAPTGCGSKGDPWVGFRLAWWLFCFAMVCQIACLLFFDVNTGMSKLETLGWMTAATAALPFGFALMDSFPRNVPGDTTDDMFRKLGFADPERVNLKDYRYHSVHIHEVVRNQEETAEHGDVYCYKKAIDDGKLKLAHSMPADAMWRIFD